MNYCETKQVLSQNESVGLEIDFFLLSDLREN